MLGREPSRKETEMGRFMMHQMISSHVGSGDER